MASPNPVRRPPAPARIPPEDSLAAALGAAAERIAAVRAGRSLGPREGLTPAAQDLAYGCLRDWGRGEFFLRALLERPLAQARIHALLLAALYRLEARPVDAHTTVDQAVEAAGQIARGRFRALVNGLLRNFLRRREALLAAAESDEQARWRHPAWWLAALRRDHPRDWQSIAAAGNSRPPMALRVNVRRLGRDACLAQLAALGIAAQPLGAQAIALERPLPVGALPGFAQGLVSVQDPGAQRAAPLLDARAGMRVLDACAAPGGKSCHLLELADVELTALDESPERIARVRENLERLGLAARLLAADCRQPARWWDGRVFERILADVPCSASGVVRRHPDAKWLRRPGDIGRFARVQAQILDALWQLLAPDGKLLYATCSVFAEENQDQVAAFAQRHADCRRLNLDDAPECQLLPDAQHDGFYYALLQKRA